MVFIFVSAKVQLWTGPGISWNKERTPHKIIKVIYELILYFNKRIRLNLVINKYGGKYETYRTR